MGPRLLLSENPSEELISFRVFEYQWPFYSRFEHRCRDFVFGERPQDLANAETIDQRIWGKHQTYLCRLENFPLRKAAYYRQLQESTGIKSVRGLAEVTGEDWSTIARVLKTLELPLPIQEFLNSHTEPAVVKHFHLRRLLELVRLGDKELQFARFREMLDEITSDAFQENQVIHYEHS